MMNDEIKNLLTSILLKMDSIVIELAEVKQLIHYDEPIDSPPVPAVPIAASFGTPLPSFEQMQESGAVTSNVSEETEAGGQ